MARLLVTADESWYDELLLIASYYETEFQRTLKQHVNNVFPDYITVNFHLPICAEREEAKKKPDLAMIGKDYKDWWIVEVELSEHRLEHVLGQIRVFSEGEYNPFRVSKYIIEQNSKENDEKLDEDKLIELIRENQPKVLVVIDEAKPEFEEPLAKYKAKLCIFQVFRNTNGREAYRLDGEYPEVPHAQSHCRYHKTIRNLLEVLSPGILDIDANKEMDINYSGKNSRWKRLDSDQRVYLRSIGGVNPIPVNHSYVLFKDANNRFLLKIN